LKVRLESRGCDIDTLLAEYPGSLGQTVFVLESMSQRYGRIPEGNEAGPSIIRIPRQPTYSLSSFDYGDDLGLSRRRWKSDESVIDR